MPSTHKTKDVGLDITRIIAFCTVVCVHFFKNTEFYSFPVNSQNMYLMVLLRTLFMICVPLFMLLTGYLMSGKEIGLTPKEFFSFYKRILPIMATFYICTFIAFIGRKYLIHEPVGITTLISDFLGFNQNSWYIGMYTGTLLLVPYINRLWQSLHSKQERTLLVFVLALLTIAPSIFNTFDFKTPGAFLHPWLATRTFRIIPDWWEALYPITYYIIGAYIKKDIDVKNLSTIKLLFLLIASLLLCTLFNCWKSYGIPFVNGKHDDWGGFQNSANSILVFLLINSIHYKNTNNMFKKFLELLSHISLAAYLSSWLFDTYFYSFLNSSTSTMDERIRFFPIIVPTVIAASFISGYIVTVIVDSIFKLINKPHKDLEHTP